MNGVTYTYDGDGNRVKKSNGTLYWYGGSGQLLMDSDLSGNYLNEYYYFGGQRIAQANLANGGEPYHYFPDQVGSTRILIGYGQNGACYDADFYPLGGERSFTHSCTQNAFKFAGLLVVGAAQRKVFGVFLFGSTTEKLVRSAPCPVLCAIGKQAKVQTEPRHA